MAKAAEGIFIVSQAANGVGLYTNKDGAMLPCGSTPATRRASTFLTRAAATKAAESFTHKPARGRPPKVVVIEVGS